MIKNKISLALALGMTLSFGAPAYASAEDSSKGNYTPSYVDNAISVFKCGDYKYSINEDKTATLQGFSSNYNDSKVVDIPAQVEINGVKYDVTAIGDNAFLDNRNIETVNVSSSVKEIGESAFSYCPYINQINFSEGLKTIKDLAFYGIGALEKLEFPNSLEYLGNEAIAGFSPSNVTEIYIPENVTHIGEVPFGLNYFSKYKVAENNKSFRDIDGVLFDKEGKTLLSFPCGRFALDYKIAGYIVPAGTVAIGKKAFADSDLESMIIPDSVTYFADDAFTDAFNSYGGSIWTSKNVIDKLETLDLGKIKLVEADINNNENFIPGKDCYKVKGEDTWCHQYCTNLDGNVTEEIIKPVKVEDGVSIFEFNGQPGETRTYIFSADALSPFITVKFGENKDSSKINTVIDGLNYKGNKDGTVRVASSDGTQDRSLKIPDSITYEGSSYEVTGIDDNAFINNYSLEEVTVPASVKTIGESAFENCCVLETVNLPQSIENINGRTFYNCPNLRTVNMSDNIKSIGNNAFAYCYNLKEVKLPQSIESIGDESFFNCANLEKVQFNDGLLDIGKSAFEYCSDLKEVILPDSMISIGDNAFNSCSSLQYISIPAGVNNLGEGVIDNCKSLKKITCIQAVYDEIKDELPVGVVLSNEELEK